MRNRWMAGVPLRLRLTLWYVLLLAFSVGLFGVYLRLQLERQLVAATDASLFVLANQMRAQLHHEDEGLTFEDEAREVATAASSSGEAFAVRLLDPAGDATGMGLGDASDVPLPRAPRPGYATRRGATHSWRVLTQPVRDGSDIEGWLEVAESLESAEQTVKTVGDQLLWGLPFVLLLAGGGGLFLANRALLPISAIADTARRVSASDLSQRLQYSGPADEIGELARTFDAMLERLEQAWIQEQRFTADAAHELRTPLAVLKGRIEVTRSRPRESAEYERTLDDLSEQVERLIRLSNDLLFLARIHQGTPREPEEVDLSQLLTSIAEQIAPLAEAKGIRLEVHADPGLVTDGETDQLIRLFLNLLQNAVTYTPAGGRVRLNAFQEASSVIVQVEDTGVGIPADALPHLFQRFYRVEDDRARVTGGAGLGLAIASEIVQMHGGTITARSATGRGTTFTVRLPGLRDSTQHT